MISVRLGIAAMLVAGVAVAATAASVAVHSKTDPVLGRWSNPTGSLALKTAPCRGGGTLCGAIIWASKTELTNARAAGVRQLVGTQLLLGYRRTGQGSWRGTIYFPDSGRRFSSRLEQTSPQALTISGCLIGGFVCKSQVWRRVG